MRFLLYIGIICLVVPCATLHAEESRMVLFSSEDPHKPFLLEAGSHKDIKATLEPSAIPMHSYLRIVGGVQMPKPFKKRGEENFRQQEFHIDDCLDKTATVSDSYSLHFQGNNDDFERKAYIRIGGERLKPGELVLSFQVKRNRFTVASEDDFGVWLELFLQKEGRDKNDVYDTPDELLFMPVPSGEGEFTEIHHSFSLPEQVAAAVVVVGGQHFSGECWMEAPKLIQNGEAVASIPFLPFDQRADTFNYWVGCNLATRFWPVWNISFNEKEIFEGALFDRASDIADGYIPLPPEVKGEGTFRLSLVKEAVSANFPYELQGIEMIQTPARDFEVVHSPGYIAAGSDFGILVEINAPDVTLSLSYSGSVEPEESEVRFEEPGLHVLKFKAIATDTKPAMFVSDGARTEEVLLGRIVEKTYDGISLSVGDDIYVDKNGPYFNEYFKWYVGQRMGNFYQFRPSYQWSGFRKPNPAMLGHLLELLQGLRMPYAWMVEGRTLAGEHINPPVEMLESPLFQGKQAHENDGGYYYWQHFTYKGFFSDMAARTRPFGGIFAKHRPIYTGKGIFIHYDPNAVTDMAQGARQLVENFAYSRGESTRHTGPSTMFRYLFQAGYEWLGAEQMYGPEETILSALRGASRAYHKEHYGSLHAMQWGSGPYTDPKHALRFYLSLATAYMHGSSHLNTEDALWTDEYANDRFSEAGKAHAAVQHRMLDFIETHTRRGELETRIGVLQGRNDAWKSFGRGPIWSQNGTKWAFNTACESFDLLKIFYPQNEIDGCGPDGWFTSTPYGPVDILPVEADQDTLNGYDVLIFLGWNTYQPEDFGRLADFVRQGGTLILSAAHLNAELAPDLPPKLPDDDEAVEHLLGDNYRELKEKTVIELEEGKAVYFPEPLYPADATLREAYTAAIEEAVAPVRDAARGLGWIAPDNAVGFAAWDEGERRTLYALDVDWKSDAETRSATLLYGAWEFPMTLRRGALETIHCLGGIAVMPKNDTTDVLDIEEEDGGWRIKIQTAAPEKLSIFNSLDGSTQVLDWPEIGIFTLRIDK